MHHTILEYYDPEANDEFEGVLIYNFETGGVHFIWADDYRSQGQVNEKPPSIVWLLNEMQLPDGRMDSNHALKARIYRQVINWREGE